jgi:hypothetical protein
MSQSTWEQPDFKRSFAFGRVGERKIAAWLSRALGYNVLPACDITPTGKGGPGIFNVDGKTIVPDLLVMNGRFVQWYEVKRKTRFAWNRNHATWVTGIDIGAYENYLRIAETTKVPVWLLFLQEQALTDYKSPGVCPTGLYGQDLAELQQHEHHRWTKPPYPMVYWTPKALLRLATIKEVRDAERL